MRKRYSFYRLFEGNMLVLFCIFFTVTIIGDVIFAAVRGNAVNLSSLTLIWRVVLLSAPLVPFAILRHLWRSDYIDEKDYLFWGSVPMHYLISAGLLLLYLFIWGLFMPLSLSLRIVQNALVNYTIVYIITIAGAIVIDLLQIARANRNLKKIQGDRERKQ